jgi:hypothetical protein
MCFCSRHYCKMRMCNKNTPCFNLLFLWSHVHSLPFCKQYAHNEHLTFTLTKSFLSDFANLKSDNYFNHQDIDIGLGLGICYLTPLSTIFQLYRRKGLLSWTIAENMRKKWSFNNEIKCQERPRMQDFAPFIPELLGALSGPQIRGCKGHSRLNKHRFFKIRLYRKGHTVIDHSERHNF